MKGRWHILLLAVWYLLAVTGIDIHRDIEHGHSYIVPSLIGGNCELIHPDHHCHDEAHEEGCLDGEDCCSNDYLTLIAQGEDASWVPALTVFSKVIAGRAPFYPFGFFLPEEGEWRAASFPFPGNGLPTAACVADLMPLPGLFTRPS